MKGFLHRLATSAARPQPRLHPFPESVYSPRPQSFADGLQEIETTVLAVAPVHRAAPGDRANHVGVHDDRANGADAASQVQERIVAKSDFQPLVSGERALHVAKNSPADELSAFSKNPFSAQETREEASADRRSQASAEGDANTPQYLPMVIERLFKDSSAEASLARPTQPQAAGERFARRETRPTVPAQAAPIAPEDIQIHIGRIEVIAAPPPAPRPAAAPARKGMSLDEYLSRRSGRVL